MRYTKGEWIIDQTIGGTIFIKDEKNELITLLSSYRDKTEANAKLIAAAPMMLEALSYARNAFIQYREAHGTDSCEAWIRMEEAIRKATK